MNPANTEIFLVRLPSGNTLGIFTRDKLGSMELDFIKTLTTNQGPVDEYELIAAPN